MRQTLIGETCPKCGSSMKRNGHTAHKTNPRQKWKCKNVNCGFCSTMTGQVGRPRSEGLCFCGKEVRIKGMCRYHYQQQWLKSNGLSRTWYRHQEKHRLTRIEFKNKQEVILCH